MVECLESSPLRDPDISPAFLEELGSLVKDVIEEPTSRGFRVKLIL